MFDKDNSKDSHQASLDAFSDNLFIDYINFLNKMNSLNKDKNKPVARKSTRLTNKTNLNNLNQKEANSNQRKDLNHLSDNGLNFSNIFENGISEIPKIKESLVILSNDILEIKNSLKIIFNQQVARNTNYVSNFFQKNSASSTNFSNDIAIPIPKVSSISTSSTIIDVEESSILVERNNFYKECASINQNSEDLINPVQQNSGEKSNSKKKYSTSGSSKSTRILRGRLRPLRSTNAHYKQLDAQKPKVKKVKNKNYNQMKAKKNNSIIMTRRQAQFSNLKEQDQSRKENISNNKSTSDQPIVCNGIDKSTNDEQILTLKNTSDTSLESSEMQIDNGPVGSRQLIKPFKIILSKLNKCPICKNVFYLEHRCLNNNL